MYSKVKRYIENYGDYLTMTKATFIDEVLLNIFSTLNQEFVENTIDHFIKERNKQKVIQKSKIEISEKIMNQITKKYINSRHKGRPLFVLVICRKIYKTKYKRKRKYSPNKVNKKKQKNIKRRDKNNEFQETIWIKIDCAWYN